MAHIPLGHRKPVSAIPAWLRPKLDKRQIEDLGLVHIVNLDAIQSGKADEQILWDMVTTVLAWSKVAEIRNLGHEQIIPQLTLAADVVARFKECGRIEFKDAAQYDLAKYGVEVMDAMAAMVDAHTAEVAVVWANQEIQTWIACTKRPVAETEAAT